MLPPTATYLRPVLNFTACTTYIVPHPLLSVNEIVKQKCLLHANPHTYPPTYASVTHSRTEMDTAVEDLSLLGDGHCAFGGGGDLWNTFMHGSAAAKDGDMWLINATSGKAYLLPIHGKSKPTKIVFHGIYYSQQSKQLYAVNHDEAAGESVEVFAVSGHAPALRLDHVASVRSPLFQNMALNDVVEGVDGSEFYVSEWQVRVGGRADGRSGGRTCVRARVCCQTCTVQTHVYAY